MLAITALWLPILLSAIAVLLASFLVWTTLHRSDYTALPDEDAALNALKPQKLKPGLYNIPNVSGGWADLKKPEILKKFEEGPIGFFTVLPNGLPSMGKNMGLSFAFYLVVGIFVAYLTSRTVVHGAEYLMVFRVAGTSAFLAYGMAVIPDAIWYGRPWKQVGKMLFDALLYGLLTAGMFGWLWPS